MKKSILFIVVCAQFINSYSSQACPLDKLKEWYSTLTITSFPDFIKGLDYEILAIKEAYKMNRLQSRNLTEAESAQLELLEDTWHELINASKSAFAKAGADLEQLENFIETINMSNDPIQLISLFKRELLGEEKERAED